MNTHDMNTPLTRLLTVSLCTQDTVHYRVCTIPLLVVGDGAGVGVGLTCSNSKSLEKFLLQKSVSQHCIRA